WSDRSDEREQREPERQSREHRLDGVVGDLDLLPVAAPDRQDVAISSLVDERDEMLGHRRWVQLADVPADQLRAVAPDQLTGVPAEAELARREGGDALLYASGMGAVTNVLLAFARTGTIVALAAGCYYGTSKLLGLLADWGISYVEYDQAGPAPPADIVWVEAPANPVLTMPDWERLRGHLGLGVCDAAMA